MIPCWLLGGHTRSTEEAERYDEASAVLLQESHVIVLPDGHRIIYAVCPRCGVELWER